MTTTTIAVSIVSVFTGIIIGIFIKKIQTDKLERENKSYQEKVIELTKDLSAKEAELKLSQDLRKFLQEDFKNIADEIIKEEQKDLREQNKEALEEKIKPLKENLDEFKDKVEKFNKQGEVQTATIKTQIESLMKESRNIQTSADKLANAIKDNSKARGNFGELILENLLKQAGLINKKDDGEKGNYITQHQYYDRDLQKNIFPDAVVFFPDNKHIVIDSKCPLNNFQNYCNADDEQEKQEQLTKFFGSVEKMADDLSGKYNNLEGLNTPEFKLMFIPLEACAGYIYSNTDLLKKAAKMNIIIVCPSTLFATLKIINRIWQNKSQSENFEKILKLVQDIYEKILIFADKSRMIQDKIKEADKSFDDLYKTTSGKGGIFSQIEKLKNYGIKSIKRDDEKYTEEKNVDE